MIENSYSKDGYLIVSELWHCPLFEKDNAKRGVLIQGMFRANFVIFGLPVAQALCGNGAVGIASVLVAMVILSRTSENGVCFIISAA